MAWLNRQERVMSVTVSMPDLHYPLRGVAEIEEEVLTYEKGLETSIMWKAYFLPEKGSLLGTWYFAPLAGCCGVVVSHGLEMRPEYRGKGYAESFAQLRFEVARKLGYSAILATSLTNNFPEIISSANAGWKLGPVFRNKRTSNDVTFQIKTL